MSITTRSTSNAHRRADPATTGRRRLTTREHEILLLVADGHSNGRIAQALWVTEQTVKYHLCNVYRKLDVANRTETTRWAQETGLLSAEPGPDRP